VVDDLRSDVDIVGTSIFGTPSMKCRHGRAFAGLDGDDMVFKLDGEAAQLP
jgi:hypothetical protein